MNLEKKLLRTSLPINCITIVVGDKDFAKRLLMRDLEILFCIRNNKITSVGKLKTDVFLG